jgi:anion-transporting  ArsA/GET3 family ATPase
MASGDLTSIPALRWADWNTRYLFFTGKGGVGKTTTASAVAVALADAGRRTLVISTDPASNLDDVFGITAGPDATAVPAVPGLFVSNLDREAAAEAFKERAVAPYRGVLPRIGDPQHGGATLRRLHRRDRRVQRVHRGARRAPGDRRI